ncbi:hypothetical protein F2Q68_00007993 [Brassica cretica]|uniref:Uncharacterized protein n=1 Tax=Brassica cretica TaxID=69181 RepID=A0A8S9KSJ4_BRACR|nr:hypothetical protein F2Q68_00007993 [Brassica cretica]
MFSELPPQEQRAALLYVSHSDDTERQARIMRVKQAIEDQGQSHVATLTRFTADLDKGKGHVFSYPDSDHSSQARQCSGPSVSVPLRKNMAGQEGYSDSESSGIVGSLKPAITTGFQIGVSSQTPSAGDRKAVKAVHRRPPSWKRKAQTEKAISKRNSSSELALTPMELVASASVIQFICLHPRKFRFQLPIRWLPV